MFLFIRTPGNSGHGFVLVLFNFLVSVYVGMLQGSSWCKARIGIMVKEEARHTESCAWKYMFQCV